MKITEQIPSLTVCLLCWNHAAYLEQCIASLANQTDKNFDIVFLDNVSSDGSFGRAADLFDSYGLQATMLANLKPKGISHNYNRLLANSRTDLICPLSTDDWYDDHYVEAMVEARADDDAAGWFSCGGWRYYEDWKRDEPIDESEFTTDRTVTEAILEGKEPHFFIGCAYRRSALETVGRWDEKLPIEDRDLFLRLSLRFAHHRISRRLVHYRRSSLTASANVEFMIKGWELFYGKHSSAFGKSLPKRRAETYRSYAALSIDRGDVLKACPLLLKALRLRPANTLSYRTLGYLLSRSCRSLIGQSPPWA